MIYVIPLNMTHVSSREASSREDYIPQTLTILLKILRVYI